MPDFDAADVTDPTPEEWAHRRAARVARYRGYADNAAARAEAARAATTRLADQIPFGQPILVGHHSEGHARADQRRLERGMRRTVEEAGKAEHWERRAEAVENDTSIRSGDPEAVVKLRARIAELEGQRQRRVDLNKRLRAGAALADLDLSEAELADLQAVARHQPYYGKKYAAGTCYPPYALSNLSGNIARLKKRLTDLEAG